MKRMLQSSILCGVRKATRSISTTAAVDSKGESSADCIDLHQRVLIAANNDHAVKEGNLQLSTR
jgi:hypothetical protein